MKISNLIKMNLAAILAAGFFILPGCSKDSNGNGYWDDPDDDPEPAEKVLKPRYIWVDAAANFPDFANSKENIKRDLQLAKNAGFTDVVVDVRPTTGDILFKSSLCDEVKSLNAWVGGKRTTIYRTETWDYLQAFIDLGHELDLRIHAGFNTMTGGHMTGGAEMSAAGILFRDKSKKEWANYRYNGGRPANVMDLADTEKFFNPANPEVVEYVCGLLKDLCKYNIDGIVLDRGRFNDLYSDFSPISQKKFEEYIGVKFSNFPADILPEGSSNTTLGKNYAKYTTKWLEFRAKTIYDFMSKCREAVKSVKSDLLFGVYVGGWYNSYYNTGVNWASKNYDPSKTAQWASPKYKDYGYAELMDQILIGAYANPKAVNGTSEWTMQGFCSQAKAKIGAACPLVVGGPDVDWRWTGSGAEYTKDQILGAITQSVGACINACDGYFLFDMIHLKIDAEKWTAVGDGISLYLDEWEASQKK